MKYNNSKLYDIAKQELASKTYDKDIWRKAMALMGNNEVKAKEKYIKLRITQLMKDDYLAEKTENNKSEKKKSEPRKENHQKKDQKQESEKVDENTEEKDSNDKPGYKKYSDRISVLGLAFGIFIGMVVVSIIWYSNTRSDNKQPNTTMVSTNDNRIVKMIKGKEIEVEENIEDSNFMNEYEVKASDDREAKEAADIEYMKAVQEMDEEE